MKNLQVAKAWSSTGQFSKQANAYNPIFEPDRLPFGSQWQTCLFFLNASENGFSDTGNLFDPGRCHYNINTEIDARPGHQGMKRSVVVIA
jgi:hypothetical protein